MRFFYADPALCDDDAHSIAVCDATTDRWRGKGAAVIILSSSSLNPERFAMLPVVPFFPAERVSVVDDDAITGWLSSYYFHANAMADELKRLRDISHGDELFIRITQPAHLGGVVRWFAALPIDRQPTVTAALDDRIGVRIAETGGSSALVLPEPSQDPGPLLYRFATRLPRLMPLPKFHMAAFNPEMSELYQSLLSLPVATLQFPVD